MDYISKIHLEYALKLQYFNIYKKVHAYDVKQSTRNYVICPQNRPYGALKLDKISLVRKACIRDQSNHFGINNLINKAKEKKDHNALRFSLYLLKEADQHLAQQGHAKEGGGLKRKRQAQRLQK